ncbi:cytochrome P450 [Rhodococcus wratislaviensis]|nr:cytochrome P450 [Rhodococcus wratislaviensis]
MSELTSAEVRIEDPDFYINDREDVYPRLHREAPVFHYEPLDVFVLSGLDDIREAARTPEIFSSASGLHLHQLRLDAEEQAVYGTVFDPAGEQFAYADPPRHRELRSIASRSFAPRAIAYLTERIQKDVADFVESVEPGRSFDFVEAAAAPLPIGVAEHFIGLPSGHADEIRGWSDALESLKLIRGPEKLREAVAQFATMNDFFREQIAFKRQNPGEDLISAMLDAELDGEPLSEANLLIYCGTFLSAGSDTTRSLLAGMIHAFAEHPEQWEKLRANPDLLDPAVEESLRWTTPARGFLRTATEDVDVHGVHIKAGQRAYLLFDAGNRDESAFADPWSFDIERPGANAHVAFGYGIHQCIAAHLARLEARILLRAIAERFSTIELAGTPTEIRQVLRAGWHEMPVVLR